MDHSRRPKPSAAENPFHGLEDQFRDKMTDLVRIFENEMRKDSRRKSLKAIFQNLEQVFGKFEGENVEHLHKLATLTLSCVLSELKNVDNKMREFPQFETTVQLPAAKRFR